jgi:hypothetical protein
MTSFYNPDRFLEILQPDRCPLCFLVRDYGQTYLRNLLGEGVTDPHSRGRLVKSQGFCRRHAWHAVAQSQSLGMSILYSHLLSDGLSRLKSLSRRWKKKSPCEVCGAEESFEKIQAKQFAAAWAHSPDLRAAFESRGLFCLPHLEKTLAQVKNRADRSLLLKTVEKALKPLFKDLNEFLEKQDYHRSQEAVGPEWDAWIRAVRAQVGERD